MHSNKIVIQGIVSRDIGVIVHSYVITTSYHISAQFRDDQIVMGKIVKHL